MVEWKILPYQRQKLWEVLRLREAVRPQLGELESENQASPLQERKSEAQSSLHTGSACWPKERELLAFHPRVGPGHSIRTESTMKVLPKFTICVSPT